MDAIAISNWIIAVIVIAFAMFALGHGDKKPAKDSEIKAALWCIAIAACFLTLLLVCKCEKL